VKQAADTLKYNKTVLINALALALALMSRG
jgi:hypothetical protein